MPAKERRIFMAEKSDVAVMRLKIRLDALLHLFRRMGGKDEHANYPHLRIKRMNDRAALEYVPQPYKGRVAVIRPKGHFAGETNPSLGWGECVHGGLEVHQLPFYPRGMLVEPFCRVLAETMTHCMQKV
jgi:hypothetical protein